MSREGKKADWTNGRTFSEARASLAVPVGAHYGCVAGREVYLVSLDGWRSFVLGFAGKAMYTPNDHVWGALMLLGTMRVLSVHSSMGCVV